MFLDMAMFHEDVLFIYRLLVKQRSLCPGQQIQNVFVHIYSAGFSVPEKFPLQIRRQNVEDW